VPPSRSSRTRLECCAFPISTRVLCLLCDRPLAAIALRHLPERWNTGATNYKRNFLKSGCGKYRSISLEDTSVDIAAKVWAVIAAITTFPEPLSTSSHTHIESLMKTLSACCCFSSVARRAGAALLAGPPASLCDVPAESRSPSRKPVIRGSRDSLADSTAAIRARPPYPHLAAASWVPLVEGDIQNQHWRRFSLSRSLDDESTRQKGSSDVMSTHALEMTRYT